jgi:undecaprenyl-diphosphatase
MELYQNLILSTFQGITELLPISSSGHLLLVSKYLFDFDLTQSTTAGLHLGTTLAIMIFYSLEIVNLLKKGGVTFVSKLFLASIPAAVIGLVWGDLIEQSLYSTIIVSASLIIWGVVMILAERKTDGEVDLNNITLKQAVLMGIAQTLALIPGTSRSGITTIAGIYSGVEKYTALVFSFILGLPVLIGASTLAFMKMYQVNNFTLDIVSVVTTLLVGIVSLYILKKISKKRFLTVFGVYRIILGVLILLLVG